MSVSQKLIDSYQDLFNKATKHKLTEELCAGTLEDKKLFIYLAQDLQFFQSGLRLTCKLTSLAPTEHSLITLAKKIGFFANDENNYFQECLELLSPSLGKEEQLRYRETRLPLVDKYIKLIEKLARDESSYAKLVTFTYCMELVYLQWPKNFNIPSNLHWKYKTWVDLHAGEHFETWCDFLKGEVDKCNYEEVAPVFAEVLKSEYEFFDSCYKN